MTEDEKHDFIADVTAHMLEEINNGAVIFTVISWRHDNERDTMQASNATVKVRLGGEYDRMLEVVNDTINKFMDAHHPRWAQ